MFFGRTLMARIRVKDEAYYNRMHAQDAVAKAVKKGRIFKPETCETCKAKAPRLYFHHTKGYAENFRLVGKWLCASCWGVSVSLVRQSKRDPLCAECKEHPKVKGRSMCSGCRNRARPHVSRTAHRKCLACGAQVPKGWRMFCSIPCSERKSDETREARRLKMREWRKTETYQKWRRAYYERDDVRQRIRDYMKIFRASPVASFKNKAGRAIARAIKTRRMVSPTRCSDCKVRGSVLFHHTHGYTRDKWFVGVWICRACHGNRHRLENWGGKKPSGRWGSLTADEKLKRRRARHAAWRAVARGDLMRPLECPECGRKEGTDRGKGKTVILFHHTRGYDKDFWLVGEWACKWCHIQKHSKTEG